MDEKQTARKLKFERKIKKKENYSQMVKNIDKELRQNKKIKASLFSKG